MLASQAVHDFVDGNYVVWGGDVSHAEAYVLMNQHLCPATFPSISVLLCKPGNTEYLVDRIEGEL